MGEDQTELPACADQGDQLDLGFVVVGLASAPPANVRLKPGSPLRGNLHLKASEQSVSPIGKRGAKKLGNSTCDFHDIVIELILAPFKSAPMAKLCFEGKVFIDGPRQSDIRKIKDLLFHIPANLTGQLSCREVPRKVAVDFWDGFFEGAIGKKGVEINVRNKVGLE